MVVEGCVNGEKQKPQPADEEAELTSDGGGGCGAHCCRPLQSVFPGTAD